MASGILLPQGIAVDPCGKTLYYLEELTQSLKAIDLQNLTLPPVVIADNLGALNVDGPGVPRVIPQGGVSSMVVDPKKGTIYVAASGAKKLWKIKRCK